MLPIYVMYDSGLDCFEEDGVKEALDELSKLFPQIPITNFAKKPWTSKREPYSSADWYVVNTPSIRGNYGNYQLDGDCLLRLIEKEPWQAANPHIDVFITSEDMTVRDNGSLLNFVFGVARGRVTVQSVARYRDLFDFQRKLCTKAVVLHEVGHIFGMAADLNRSHTEYLLGPHCTNYGCVMRQGLTVHDWAEHAYQAHVHGPYCPECLSDAKKSAFLVP